MARIFETKDELVKPNRNFTPQEELLNRVVAAIIRCASGIESGSADDLACQAVVDALRPEFDAMLKVEGYKETLTNAFELGMRITHAVMTNTVNSESAVKRALQIACGELDEDLKPAIEERKIA